MIRTFLGLVAALGLVVFTATAEAAIEAGAYLNISSFKVIDASDNTTATIGVGGDITGIDFVLQRADSEATLNGVTDSNLILLSLDSPVSYVDGGLNIGPENTFSPRPLGPSPYARGDTFGAGSALAPVAGSTPGATVDTIADVVVPNSPLISDLGNSSSTATQNSFSITVPNQLSLRLEFDYLLDQTLDYTAPPLGLMLTSGVTFNAQISGVGLSGPNVVGSTFTFEPSELNTTVTRATPGVTNGGDGVQGSLVSPTLTLAPGTYTFTINQGASAAIAPVPEAASVLTWAVLAMCGVAATVVSGRRAIG